MGESMNKDKKSFFRVIINRTLFVSFAFTYGCFLCGGNTKVVNNVNNINSNKSIKSYNLVTKYVKTEEKVEPLLVKTMEEAATYGPQQPINFVGEMTAYKANCKGCTGLVACPPSQDVRNNNIWYQDKTYGKVRIVAADRNIPCGTIVEITNITFSNETITGIVLDRGGAIKGNIMDFLVGESDDMDIVGRQKNVNYEVVRWGW